jgi:hypothetical protein
MSMWRYQCSAFRRLGAWVAGLALVGGSLGAGQTPVPQPDTVWITSVSGEVVAEHLTPEQARERAFANARPRRNRPTKRS